MELGSTLVLTKSINPSIDYEEIDETDYSAGVRSAMEKNINSRGGDICLLDILDTYEWHNLRTLSTDTLISVLAKRSILEFASNT